jgi:hypothetical protein
VEHHHREGIEINFVQHTGSTRVSVDDIGQEIRPVKRKSTKSKTQAERNVIEILEDRRGWITGEDLDQIRGTTCHLYDGNKEGRVLKGREGDIAVPSGTAVWWR